MPHDAPRVSERPRVGERPSIRTAASPWRRRDPEPLPSTTPIMLMSGDVARATGWRDELERTGYPVDVAPMWAGVWPTDRARTAAADVLIIDVAAAMPDACRLIRSVRDDGNSAYVLALTPAADDAAVLEAVDAGADACAERSCSPRELVGRVRCLVRRRRSAMGGEGIRVGDLTIDPSAHSVWRGHLPITLSPREFALLLALARQRGRVISRDELLGAVWGRTDTQDSHVIDTVMLSLRRKIERDPVRPAYVVTVRTAGFLIPR